jgi:hypothetical protein
MLFHYTRAHRASHRDSQGFLSSACNPCSTQFWEATHNEWAALSDTERETYCSLADSPTLNVKAVLSAIVPRDGSDSDARSPSDLAVASPETSLMMHAFEGMRSANRAFVDLASSSESPFPLAEQSFKNVLDCDKTSTKGLRYDTAPIHKLMAQAAVSLDGCALRSPGSHSFEVAPAQSPDSLGHAFCVLRVCVVQKVSAKLSTEIDALAFRGIQLERCTLRLRRVVKIWVRAGTSGPVWG